MKNKRQYFGACYAIEDVAAGEEIPVGGTNMLNGELNRFLQADFDSFDAFYAKTQAFHAQINIERLTPWLESVAGKEASPQLFAALFAFQTAFAAEYPQASENTQDRAVLYSTDKPAVLSDVIAKGCAMCAEISLLAHGYLNRMGIENKIFNGALLRNPAWEFSDEHMFILLPQNGGAVVFDPANPVRSDQGNYPSLYRADARQYAAWEAKALQGKNFMRLQNMLTGTECLYGVNNATNVDSACDFTEKTRAAVQLAIKPVVLKP